MAHIIDTGNSAIDPSNVFLGKDGRTFWIDEGIRQAYPNDGWANGRTFETYWIDGVRVTASAWSAARNRSDANFAINDTRAC